MYDNENVTKAKAILDGMSKRMYDLEVEAIATIKKVLAPMKDGYCPIGSEDFAEDIYYAYGEPEPNVFRRVLGLSYDESTDTLKVYLDGEKCGYMDDDGCVDWSHAYIGDVQFLLEEIICNIEYCDGYQDGDEPIDFGK